MRYDIISGAGTIVQQDDGFSKSIAGQKRKLENIRRERVTITSIRTAED